MNILWIALVLGNAWISVESLSFWQKLIDFHITSCLSDCAACEGDLVFSQTIIFLCHSTNLRKFYGYFHIPSAEDLPGKRVLSHPISQVKIDLPLRHKANLSLHLIYAVNLGFNLSF